MSAPVNPNRIVPTIASEIGISTRVIKQTTPVSSDQPNLKVPVIGDSLGKCYLTNCLGRGSVGVVFRALHMTQKASVAVKVLASAQGTVYQEAVQVFAREADLLTRINHRNLVQVIDFAIGEMPYLVMEFVQGSSLAELLRCCGRMQPPQAVAIFRQMADALIVAEEVGIVHHGIKPANILVGPNGTAKLADLGLVPPRPIGNPSAYHAPEQLQLQGTIDKRTDLFALGVSFYQAVTGFLPYDLGAVADPKRMRPPLQPHQCSPEVSPSLSQVILKMIARKPADRFPNAAAFRAALDQAAPSAN